MNLSGESIRSLVDYYKIDPEEELIVLYDDISLDPGNIRIRAKGSAGGHNAVSYTHLDVYKRQGSDFYRNHWTDQGDQYF